MTFQRHDFLLLLFVSLQSGAASATAAPRNHFLADSSWPMIHGGPANQDASESPFASVPIDTQRDFRVTFFPGEPVPITLAASSRYPNGQRAIWGNTRHETFKLVRHSTGWKKIAFRRDPQSSTEISGAYALLDVEGRYFVPRDLEIDVFFDATPGELQSAISYRRYPLTALKRWAHRGEHFVGCNLTYDGQLAVVSERGLVGIISRDGLLLATLRLFGDVEVSNSFAIDDQGGLYILTQKQLTKIRWHDGLLTKEWDAPYPSDEFVAPGRLGSGSGTTPTLMGFGPAEDHLVVFADGQEHMRLVAMWRDDIPQTPIGLNREPSRLASSVPITFGKTSPSRVVTEQSIVVSGFQALVVDNTYGYIGPLAERIARERFGADLNQATIYLSNSRGVAPYGVEQFRWDEANHSLRSLWARSDLSCPNGIPVTSRSDNLAYCWGQRRERWTLEAFQWQTGQPAFHIDFNKKDVWNSFYAGLSILDDGLLATGTYGGVVLIETKPTSI